MLDTSIKWVRLQIDAVVVPRFVPKGNPEICSYPLSDKVFTGTLKMSVHTFMNCFLIFIGAIIMFISMLGTRGLMSALHFVPGHQRRQIRLYLLLHRALMGFFLCGYLVVLAAFSFHYSFISETFVSLIFFLGSIFVFVGVSVQSRLMSEVQNTLQGILPICCKCKKIRNVDADQRDPMAWMKLEKFLSENIHVDFSHGLCPDCFDEEMKDLRKMN